MKTQTNLLVELMMKNQMYEGKKHYIETVFLYNIIVPCSDIMVICACAHHRHHDAPRVRSRAREYAGNTPGVSLSMAQQ